MSFTKPPEWKNAGAEPPTELVENGFVAGYKPPAGYFNWFWNKVSVCIKELQEKFNKSSTATVKTISVDKSKWLLDSTSGYYKALVTDTSVDENTVVTVNISMETNGYAVACGLQEVNLSVSGGYYLYAKKVPSGTIKGTVVVQKGEE